MSYEPSPEDAAGVFVLGAIAIGTLMLTGCATVNWKPAPAPDAMTYYETVDYLQVDTAKDCSKKLAIIAMPGKARSVNVSSGIGASNVTLALDNGMIKSLGQQVDTKIPDTLSAIGGTAANLKVGAGLNDQICLPGTKLYPITNGAPDLRHPLPLD